jgi:hypothetical protein
VYKVTNLNNAGTGSLRACVEARGPRVCIFEVSGQIWANTDIRAIHPYLTVAGQTAPAPGIVIRGSTFSVEASHVVVQNIKMRVGDDPRDPCCKTNSCSAAVAQFCTSDPGSRDGMRIRSATGEVRHVILDHVSVAWALDEGISMVPEVADIKDVTISNTIITQGLDMSIHPEANTVGDEGHSKAFLINGARAVERFSFIKNLLTHNADRNIRISTPVTMEYINNVVFGWGRGRGAGRTIELTNKRTALHMIDVIGNLYLPGLDTFCPSTQYKPELCFENGQDGVDSATEQAKMHYILRVGGGVSSGLSSLSRYHLSHNLSNTRLSQTQDEWDVADRTFFSNPTQGVLVYPANRATAPVASSQSVAVWSLDQVLPSIRDNVGAFPSNRDFVDASAVADAQNRTGRIVNCVQADGSTRCQKNAGGWPMYPMNQRPLTLPNGPMGDDDGDGYTNLEEWLHSFAY